MRSILVLAIVSLVVHARPAHACSCGIPGSPMSPANGATQVPRNAVLFFDASLAPVSQIQLAGPNIVVVPVTTEQHGAFVIARPASALAANTTYTVSFTQNSNVMTSTFTTGNSSDTTAPGFPGVMGIRPEYMQFDNGTGTTGQACVACDVHSQGGRISRIHFDFPDPTGDAVVLGVEIYIPGDSNLLEEFAVTPANFTDRLLGFRGCGPTAPNLNENVTYCARVVAYDAAGNAAGSASEACNTPTACEAQMDMTCEPIDACIAPQGGDAGTGTGTHTGGCASSSGAGALLALLAFVPALRRRRG